MKTTEKIKVRACQLICNDHPEWGTFGVCNDQGEYYEIHGDGGHRILFKHEADEFWSVVEEYKNDKRKD